MYSEGIPRATTPVIMAFAAALIVAAALLSLPTVLLEDLLGLTGWSVPQGTGARALLAGGGGLLAGTIVWMLLQLFRPDMDEVAQDYDVFRDEAPVLRPIFASTDLGAPFNSICADGRILPFENGPVAEGDDPVMGEPGRMLWEPDPWFDELQDPEPALIEPSRWGAPVLESKPIAALTLAELVARLEAGMRRRKAVAAAVLPISTPAPRPSAFSPIQDMDDALRDALGTLQRLAARSA